MTSFNYNGTQEVNGVVSNWYYNFNDDGSHTDYYEDIQSHEPVRLDMPVSQHN